LHDLWERSPVLRSYTPEQQDRTAEDLQHIIEFLATALYFDDPDNFPRARRFLNETAPALDPFATPLSVTGTGTPA
ncbi:cobalamin-binding protein, partial [Streptomyces sp. NPDC057052]